MYACILVRYFGVVPYRFGMLSDRIFRCTRVSGGSGAVSVEEVTPSYLVQSIFIVGDVRIKVDKLIGGPNSFFFDVISEYVGKRKIKFEFPNKNLDIKEMLLGLRQWLSKDTYGLIIKMLSKHDLVFVYLAHGCKIKLTIDTMNYAAECGYINQMIYLHEKDCEWDLYTPSYAAQNGHLECLRYAHEKGCDWDSSTPMYAAKNGHLECLKYAYTEGCKWNSNTPAQAALNGHLECLKYAHENGCEWDSNTPMYAAKNGHLECLKYAHENDCEWDSFTPAYAAQNGHLECLKYAHEKGCDWDSSTPMYAAKNGHLECLKYARAEGCPEN
jgi:uncharacterized membrane protein YjdF